MGEGERNYSFLDQCTVYKEIPGIFTLGTMFFYFTVWSSARLSQFWRAMNTSGFDKAHFPLGRSEAGVILHCPVGTNPKKTKPPRTELPTILHKSTTEAQGR